MLTHTRDAITYPYTGKGTDLWVAASSDEEARQKAHKRLADVAEMTSSPFNGSQGNGRVEVVQDEDVLDTWFSSALVPMSVSLRNGVRCVCVIMVHLRHTPSIKGFLTF